MYNDEHFTLEDMSRLGSALRRCTALSGRLDAYARNIVQHLYDSLRDQSGNQACAAVRFFKIHPIEELPSQLKSSVPLPVVSDAPSLPAAKCLVLLAQIGIEPLEEDALLSCRRKVISLSEVVLQRSPSFAAMITQFGLDLAAVLAAEPVYVGDASHRACDVFHTGDVPAQMAAQGVRSVLGFGGLLPSGSLFFVLLYLYTEIAPSCAAMFRPIAINVKMPLLKYDGRSLGIEHPTAQDEGDDSRER